MGKFASKNWVNKHKDAAERLLAACSRHADLEEVKDVILNLTDGSYISAKDGLIEFEDDDDAAETTSVLADSQEVTVNGVNPAKEIALCQNGFSVVPDDGEVEIIMPYEMPTGQVPALNEALAGCDVSPSALDTILVLHSGRHFCEFWKGVETMMNMPELALSPVFLSQPAVNLVYKGLNLSAEAQLRSQSDEVRMTIQFAGILGVAISCLKNASLLPTEVAEAYAAIIQGWPEVETIVTATGSVLLEEHRKSIKALAA